MRGEVGVGEKIVRHEGGPTLKKQQSHVISSVSLWPQSGAGKPGLTFIMVASSSISRITVLLITSLVSKGKQVR